jgi:hypothetical protein
MVQKIAALLVGFLVAFGASTAVVGLRAKPPAPVPPASAAHDSAGGEGSAAHAAPHPDSATKESVHVMHGADSSAAAESLSARKHPAPAHESAPASVPSRTVAQADAKPESAKSSAAPDSAAGAGKQPVGFAVSPERRLAKIFSAMQPKDAARVLEQMSDGDVQAIIAMLGDRQAAAVLANFPPERAAVIGRLTMRGVAMRGGAK